MATVGSERKRPEKRWETQSRSSVKHKSFAQEKREGWSIPVPVGVSGLVRQVGGGCGAVVDAVHEPGEEAAVQLLG